MKIIIDADACPRAALQICRRLGKQYQIPVWTVASFEHRIDSEHHIVVGNNPEEVDIKLINLAEPGDIAVTQDWGLAAMLLGRGARCLSPTGRRFDNANIDFLLEERNIKLHYRSRGSRIKGPKKRGPADDRSFEASLKQLLSEHPYQA